MAQNYRVLLPNGLTFLSLLCGMAATLVAAATGTAADAPRQLWCAGLLILASYLLDWSDGLVARTLHASTAFGLQLDSLVDMVSLGVAPTVVLFLYSLWVMGISPWLSGPVVVLVPLAGAFRLARFNRHWFRLMPSNCVLDLSSFLNPEYLMERQTRLQHS